MTSEEFRAWLDRNDVTPQEYAKLTQKSANTIYRRLRGEIKIPPEVAALLESLEVRRSPLTALETAHGARL